MTGDKGLMDEKILHTRVWKIKHHGVNLRYKTYKEGKYDFGHVKSGENNTYSSKRLKLVAFKKNGLNIIRLFYVREGNQHIYC